MLSHLTSLKTSIIIIFFLGGFSNAVSEFLCRTEISYKWKREKEEVASESLYSSLEQKGVDEKSAKDQLLQKVPREKGKALEHCRKHHQNLAGCIATKYGSVASVLQTLGFSARKAVQDAIAEDCGNLQGQCGEIVSSDPVCQELVAAEGEEGKDKKKKDDKGKKK